MQSAVAQSSLAKAAGAAVTSASVAAATRAPPPPPGPESPPLSLMLARLSAMSHAVDVRDPTSVMSTRTPLSRSM